MNATRLSSLAVLIGSVLLTGCASQPTLERIGARLLDTDLRGVDMAFDLDVRNPYPIPLDSVGGRYALEVAGKPFASWDEVPGLLLPANEVGTITLPARVDYVELFKVISAARSQREFPYRLTGALVFPVMGQSIDLPFTHEGVIPGPEESLRNINLFGE